MSEMIWVTLIASIAAQSTFPSLKVLQSKRAKRKQLFKIVFKPFADLFGIDAWITYIAKHLWDLKIVRESRRFGLNPVTHPRVVSRYVQFLDRNRLG